MDRNKMILKTEVLLNETPSVDNITRMAVRCRLSSNNNYILITG